METNPNEKWDHRFLAMADLVAGWSKDPSTRVGAVIVRPDKTVCSVGFNGFPRYVDDSDAAYLDRTTKYKQVKHAEENAILFANEPLLGYTLYVTPLLPCSLCAGDIIQKGIRRVVAAVNIESFNRCIVSPDPVFGFDLTEKNFRAAGIEYWVVYPNGSMERRT